MIPFECTFFFFSWSFWFLIEPEVSPQNTDIISDPLATFPASISANPKQSMVALVQSMDCKISSFNLLSFSHAIPHLEPYLSNRHIFISVLVPSLLVTAIDVACGSDTGCSLCREEHGDNASHLKCRVGELQDVEHFPSLGCFLLDVLWDVIDSTLLTQISIKNKNPLWIPWEHLLSWLIITYCETFPKKSTFHCVGKEYVQWYEQKVPKHKSA